VGEWLEKYERRFGKLQSDIQLYSPPKTTSEDTGRRKQENIFDLLQEKAKNSQKEAKK
jgi:hypothetical protein